MASLSRGSANASCFVEDFGGAKAVKLREELEAEPAAPRAK
jgi:hypothetical protein